MPARHTGAEADSQVCYLCNRYFHLKCEGLVGKGGAEPPTTCAWKCRDCDDNPQLRRRLHPACKWNLVTWADSTEPAEQMQTDHPDLVQQWEDEKRRREEESRAAEHTKAPRGPRDALLADRERQGVRVPPETQYDITIGNPIRTKLTVERRPVDPELDTVAGAQHTLQARRPPAHRAPGRLGHQQGPAGMGPLQDGPECVCAYDAWGSCVAVVPARRARLLAEWAAPSVRASGAAMARAMMALAARYRQRKDRQRATTPEETREGRGPCVPLEISQALRDIFAANSIGLPPP